MKQILLSLFLLVFFWISPQSSIAAISLEITNYQQFSDYSSVDVVIHGLASSSAAYLQGVYTHPDSPHYFGQTWSAKGEWVKYLSSPEKDFIKENFPKVENDHLITILIKPDIEDIDYKGPGEYLFKLRRYTGESSSSAGDSNVLTVNLTDSLITTTPTPSAVIDTVTPTATIPTSTDTPTPTPSPRPSSTSTPTLTPKPTLPTTKPSSVITPSTKIPPPKVSDITPSLQNDDSISSSESSSDQSLVLGESTSSADLLTDKSIKNETNTSTDSGKIQNSRLYYITGGAIMALSSAFLLIKRLVHLQST